jgi:hypothetical protein
MLALTYYVVMINKAKNTLILCVYRHQRATSKQDIQHFQQIFCII